MARRRKKFKFSFLVLLLLFVLAAFAIWYFFLREKPKKESGKIDDPSEEAGGEELSIHFLELGNKYAGDCVFVHIGDCDVLIDGGSRESSADTIEKYVKTYCTDNILEYVIVTHADQDHIAAFAGNGSNASLFERFECKTIIDFPLTNKNSKTYLRYLDSREKEVSMGATRFSALECFREENGAKKSYALSKTVSINFLYNYFYEHKTSDENNYSVCFTITQNKESYLFSGDLEKEGEEKLVSFNELPSCRLYKAGHHGSKTSSSEALLSVIRPEVVCICCCAGAPEYTSNPDNVFPTRDALKRIFRYTEKVYVTGMAKDVDLEQKSWDYAPLNGNIVFSSDGDSYSVIGSNSSLPLGESEWYLQNRS